MRATLRDLKEQLRLRGATQKLDPNLQDRLGYHLLKRRGYEAFADGRLSTEAFALALAQEWASMPVLRACKGAHRTVNRGQSYYAGDGQNRALISPEKFESALAAAKAAISAAPTSPKPEEKRMPSDKPSVEYAPSSTAPLVLDKPQVVQPAFTSKTLIGLVVAAFGLLSTWKPTMFPAALAPLLEQGLDVAIGMIGLALAAYGRFKAEGPIGFVMKGGMSDVRQLQAQVEELRRLVEQGRSEISRKRA